MGRDLLMPKVEPITSPSGATLNLRCKLPESTPKALIHINHGMAEHSARYGPFAEVLAAHGYAVYAHDHRGHGETNAPDAALGHFAKSDGWIKVLQDVQAVQQHMRGQHPGLPVVTFGHSMGSIIAFNHALTHPHETDGLALWNSGVETGALAAVFSTLLKVQRFFKGSDVPSPLAKQLTFQTWNKVFAPNRTDFDWLSRDEAEVDAYVADPLCGFDVTIGLWLDLLKGIYFAANDSNLSKLPKSLPVHLLAGAKDPCTENGKAVAHIEQRMKEAGLTDVSFALLDDTRHESLNELNKAQTIADFIRWLDARFAA